VRTLGDYEGRYRHIAFERRDGILQMSLHSKGAELKWSSRPHDELGFAFADVAADRENLVVILTGTGDAFIRESYWPEWEQGSGPSAETANAVDALEWEEIRTAGHRMLMTLLDVPVPMIAAVNGPATIHPELAALCDIVIASETTVFQDTHMSVGMVPADGAHVIWPELLGANRGRYFLLTSEQLSAGEALRLGVVNEVVPHGEELTRAWAIAAELARLPELTLRYARLALIQRWKRLLLDGLNQGLALEGLGATGHWAGAALRRPSGTPGADS
jgi:enoyl-CoA hydratase/carnithine racemase